MTSKHRIEIVDNLVKWYACGARANPAELPAQLAEHFRFDDRGLVADREDFMLGVSTFAGFSEFSFLERACDGESNVALLFEVTDIATGLRIRDAWFVRFEGDKIARITATSSQL